MKLVHDNDVFISHKVMVGAVLTQTFYSSQIDQDEDLLLIWSAMALIKRNLMKQDPFNSSFSLRSLISPVEETVLSFVNVVLHGPLVR